MKTQQLPSEMDFLTLTTTRGSQLDFKAHFSKASLLYAKNESSMREFPPVAQVIQTLRGNVNKASKRLDLIWRPAGYLMLLMH